jgi:hypothetical protein
LWVGLGFWCWLGCFFGLYFRFFLSFFWFWGFAASFECFYEALCPAFLGFGLDVFGDGCEQA